MDLQSEQAVWRRVRGPGNMTAEEAVLPERLEAVTLEQQALAAYLRGLSGKLRGPRSAAAAAMARQTEQSVRELTALHYLLTGRRFQPRPPRQELPAPLPEALRQACLRTKQTGLAFDALQAEFSAYGTEFGRMAALAREHSRRLMELLRLSMQEAR